MSSYTLERLPDAPVILLTAFPSWDTSTDAPVVFEQIKEMLDTTDEPLYYMNNLLEATFGLADVVLMGNIIAKAVQVMRHPNLKGTIVVSTHKMIELGARGMNTEAFGNILVMVFGTLDEALDYARSH